MNTTFGYTVFLIGLYLGLHYSVAIALATVLGVAFNYRTIGTLVFKSREKSRIPHFIGVYCVIYAINVAGVGLLLKLGITEWLGGLILMLPLAFLSYVMNSRYVFTS